MTSRPKRILAGSWTYIWDYESRLKQAPLFGNVTVNYSYDPEVGRFISEDPIRFEGGVNFDAYVDNRPLRYTDPSGSAQ